MHRNDRARRHGGGVAIHVRNTLSSRIVNYSENLTDGSLEYMIVELWYVERKKVLYNAVVQ